MKGGNAIYCPQCSKRQTVGKPGEKIELPTAVVCEHCGARLTLQKSESGGVHIVADIPITP
ncbi:MAG TPA: hypothetical protein VF021_07350 [Longimicrobiales bacterium]